MVKSEERGREMSESGSEGGRERHREKRLNRETERGRETWAISFTSCCFSSIPPPPGVSTEVGRRGHGS